MRTGVEFLFGEFIDIFEFSYKTYAASLSMLWLVTYWIELNRTITPSHQASYCMNLNYAKAVKIDLKGLLSAGFIAPVNQATWLSPITVVPKKNAYSSSLSILVNSIPPPGKIPIYYSLQVRSLTLWLARMHTLLLIVFHGTTKSASTKSTAPKRCSSWIGARTFGLSCLLVLITLHQPTSISSTIL